jgi:autotransporter-associated beta strand protein
LAQVELAIQEATAMNIRWNFARQKWKRSIVSVICAMMLTAGSSAPAQRLLGIDVSAYQNNLSAGNWTTLHTTNSRDFAFIRSSRGGTTGFDHGQDNFSLPNADCNGASTNSCLSRRYDDPYFGQNITRATNEGLFTGPYHFSRADIVASTADSGGIANTGTDDANHFIQMAGAWMRPGYLPPVMDLEAGQSQRTADQLAQFCLDFSNQIYSVMGIRPVMYINGSYANTTLGSAPSSVRDQLAKPSSNGPSVVAPAFPTLWTARYPNGSGNQYTGNVQTDQPDNTVSTVYGPWDDYGSAHPWAFWQYSSGERLSGYSLSAPIDADVSQGDVEYLKDHLVPALWWNDTSGDWSTLSNWNGGQTPIAPAVGANQSPVQGSTTLPTARLPGAAGSGPTSGQHDTVILERPNASLTVTLSTGAHNIRKLYMRETLNITGGTLTINYDPNYVSDTVNYPNALRSGPISAQFSGPVTLSGSGNLSVNTLQVDAAQIFTLAGSSGTLTFNTIKLMPHSTTPAKIAVTGDLNIDPFSNATATIANGTGAGTSGFVDLGGGTRAFNVGNGTSTIDLAVNVPVTNGALTKNGLGTMQLGIANTFSGPVMINDGILRVTGNNQLGVTGVTTNMTVVTPGSAGAGHGGTLQLSGNVNYNLPLTIGGGGANGVSLTAPGSIGALDNSSGDNTWSGTVTLAGTGANGTDPLENQIGAQAGVLRVNGALQDAVGVSATWAKTGDGDVVLGGTAASTFSGLTRVFGGRLIIEKDGALGIAGSALGSTSNTFQNTGSASTIAFRAPSGSGGFIYNTFEVINTNGTGAPGFGQVDNLGGDNTFGGRIAFDGPAVSGARQVSIGVASGSLNVTGGLYARGSDGSPRNITKLGGGTLIVSGNGGAATGNTLVAPLTNSTFNVSAGTVELRGPSASTANLPGVTTWNVAGGATLLASTGRFSTGAVNVAAGGQFNLTGGSTDLTTIDLSGGGSFGLNGGTLHAQTIVGNVANQGATLSPGSSPGSTSIVGNYVQQSGGKLEIEIGGTVAATDFDVVNVTGNALVNGLIDVSLINGFTPTPGQKFTVMTAGSVTYDGLALTGSAASSFYLLVGPSSVTLQAAGLLGDYNFDGKVDAGDYVVWRKGPGYLLMQYDLWRTHFGESAGSGSGAAINSTVPEPTAALLLVCGLLPLFGRRARADRMVSLRNNASRLRTRPCKRNGFSAILKCCG